MKLLFMFVILVSSQVVSALCPQEPVDKAQVAILNRDMTKVECRFIPGLKPEDRYTYSSCNAYKTCLSALDRGIDLYSDSAIEKEKYIKKQIAERHAQKKIKNEIADRLKFELLKLQLEKTFPQDSSNLSGSVKNALNSCEQKYKVTASSSCNPELMPNSYIESEIQKIKKNEADNDSLINNSIPLNSFKKYMGNNVINSINSFVYSFEQGFHSYLNSENPMNPLLSIFGKFNNKNKFILNSDFMAFGQKISSKTEPISDDQRRVLFDEFVVHKINALAESTCKTESQFSMQMTCEEATQISNGNESYESMCSNRDLNIFLADQGPFDLDFSYQTCKTYMLYNVDSIKQQCEGQGFVESPIGSGNYIYPVQTAFEDTNNKKVPDVKGKFSSDQSINTTVPVAPLKVAAVVPVDENVKVEKIADVTKEVAKTPVEPVSKTDNLSPATIAPSQSTSQNLSSGNINASIPTPVTYAPISNNTPIVRGNDQSSSQLENTGVQTLNDNLDKLTKKVEATQTQLADQTHQTEIAALNQKIADLQAAPVSKAPATAVSAVLISPVVAIAPTAAKEDAVVPVEAKEVTPASTASTQHASNEKATPAIAPSASAGIAKTATVSSSNGSGVLNLEIHDVPNVDLLHQDHQVPNDSILELARNSKEEHFAITDKNKIVWIVTPLYEKGVIVDYVAVTQSDYDKKSKEKLAHTIKKPNSRAPAAVSAKKHSLLSDLNKLLDGKKK